MTKRWKTWLAVAVLLTAGLTIYAGRPELTPVGTTASQETDRWLSAIGERAQNGYWIVVRGTHPGDQLVAAASAARLTHAALLDVPRAEVIEAGRHVNRANSKSGYRRRKARVIRARS